MPKPHVRVRSRSRVAALGVIGAAGALAVGYLALRDAGRDRVADLAAGRALYEAHCAACHGANLEGAPDWQRPGPNGRLPAPPHDATGHTWHHDDALLFRITKYGTAAVVGGDYESDMVGFGDVLSDGEIEAVLAYIKSTWPERQRAFQAEIDRRAEAGR